MAEIDVTALQPVGEFGARPWCEAVARYGVQLLQEADLPADLQWGFSEIYTHLPRRLLEGGRRLAACHIMVKDGQVSGGDGAPEECRALPGFHVQMRWAAICNQSRSKYGREGQRRRSEQEAILYAEIERWTGVSNPLGLRPRKDVWPPEVAAALGEGAEQGGGLHNIAASLQAPSPEFDGLPTTNLGVPVFSEMTAEQKAAFLKLCGVGGG